MFKVDNPAFLKIKHSDQVMDHFLHLGQKKELVFFTKKKIDGGGHSLTLNFLDNETAINAPDNQLTQLSSNLFQAPLHHQIQFRDKLLLDLLQYLLIVSENRVESKAMFELLPVGALNLLVVTAPYALNTTGGVQKWEKTEYDNIIFIDLGNQTIKWIIYDGELLIAVTQKENSGKLKEVLFLRSKQIIKMEWGSPVR